MKKYKMLMIAAMILLMATGADAALFLDDWGVRPGAWSPTSAPAGTQYVEEDYLLNDAGQVGPGYGGQAFDAEAAYMSIVTTGGSSKLYAAIVTGLSQAGSKDPWRYNNSSYGYDDWNQSKEKYWYDSGDVGFDIGGDGTYEYAVTTRNTDVHSTYNPTPGAGLLVSGNLQWEDPLTWNYNDVTEDWNHVSDPWAVKSYDDSVDLGSNFSYSEFQGRYAIEMIIDLSLMDLNEWDALHMVWTMECGNDQITLDMVIPAINGGSSVNPVPEPGTIILLGAGLAGLGVLRRSRRS